MRLYINDKDEDSIHIKSIDVIRVNQSFPFDDSFRLELNTPHYESEITLLMSKEDVKSLFEEMKKALEGGKNHG
jgi:hypothetical protein